MTDKETETNVKDRLKLLDKAINFGINQMPEDMREAAILRMVKPAWDVSVYLKNGREHLVLTDPSGKEVMAINPMGAMADSKNNIYLIAARLAYSVNVHSFTESMMSMLHEHPEMCKQIPQFELGMWNIMMCAMERMSLQLMEGITNNKTKNK